MVPTVSIITPLYNAERFITETIESVLQQTYENWEWIIVNDCSTDRSVEIVESYLTKEPRIQLINLKKNSGTGFAKNTALNSAKGNYISFIDSDDCWLPEKLEKQLNFMQEKNCPISFTSYEIIDQDSKRLNRVVSSVKSLTQHEYLKNTIIGFSTSMIDKRKTGEFEIINLRSREDTHLWINLLGRGIKAYGIDEVLVKYRVHDSSITTNKFKAAQQTWNLYYNIEKFGLIKSAFYFSNYVLNAFNKHYL